MAIFRQFRKMLAAHFKMTFREKQSLFWSIFFPVILMVVFMIIFGSESNNEFTASIVIVEEHPTEETKVLHSVLQKIPVFDIQSLEPNSVESAKIMIMEKKADAAIILSGAEESRDIQLVVNTENEQNATTQAVIGILNNFIHQMNLQIAGIQPTYKLKTEFISSGENPIKFKDFILTGLIALSLCQGGLFGMSNQVDLRRKGVIKRLKMTPANMGLFGLSDMVMRTIFALFQLTLLSMIGVIFFDVTLHIHVWSLLYIFLIGILSFNAIGYFLSSISKTMEAYVAMGNIISFIMMFLSGVMIPIETMPEWIHPISYVLPLTYFVDGVRTSMIYDHFYSDWIGILNIFLWGITSYLLGYILYKRKGIASER